MVRPRTDVDVWSLALMCLDMLWDQPLLHEPFARLGGAAAPDPHYPYVASGPASPTSRSLAALTPYLRWLAHDDGPISLPAATSLFPSALRALMARLLQVTTRHC